MPSNSQYCDCNKYFLCDLWKPKTLYEDIDNDTFRSSPYYFKHMNIGIPNGNGNHALFKATAENKDLKINIHLIDESEFLKNLEFKNCKVYYKGEVFEYVDHRCLALMLLTKIKLEKPNLSEFKENFLWER